MVPVMPTRHKRDGFSLVELLLVLAIVATLIAVISPSIQSLVMGGALTRSGQTIADQMALARQEALSRNRDVQVRFIRFDTEPVGYRAVQLWAPSRTDGTAYEPISRLTPLPEGTQLAESDTLSPLIEDAPQAPGATMTVPGRGNADYFAFRFRAGGGTDLDYGSRENFLTVISSHGAATEQLPDNYVVLQIDAENGQTRVYRP